MKRSAKSCRCSDLRCTGRAQVHSCQLSAPKSGALAPAPFPGSRLYRKHAPMVRGWERSTSESKRQRLFSRRVMVIADHASDLPCSVFVLPQMNELAFANSDAVFVSGMVKAMHANFESAISFH